MRADKNLDRGRDTWGLDGEWFHGDSFWEERKSRKGKVEYLGKGGLK